MTHARRIGIDGRELAGGARTGIGRFLQEVLRAGADAEGWQFVLYANGHRLEPPGPHVQVRVLPGGWTQWWDQVTLPRQAARDGASVLLSPYYKGPLLAACPLVLTIHDLFFIGYPGRRRPLADAARTTLARLYAGRATAIITDSQHSKRSIVTRLDVDPARVTVIPVALGAEFTPTPLSDAVRRRYGVAGSYILYLGNFKPHKNLPGLLRAYARLPRALRDAHRLVLAGGDDTHGPALQAIARALEIADRVVWPGRIDEADLPALYSGCALFVLPSLDEGFGLPALEAMGCGAPVVASARGAIPEVVGDAGLLADPDDDTAVAATMGRVLADGATREALRRRGLARVREFAPERTSARVVALLQAVAR
jgi:glycosyltransferase involved in cell wall biosynthesis